MAQTQEDIKPKMEKPQDVARLHTKDTARGGELDVLGGRYEVQIQNPLPEFSSEYCKAYVAVDRDQEHKRVYALLGFNEYPFRDRATEIMQKGNVPHLVRCYASGPVTMSDTQRTHRCFILHHPRGKKLSEILQHSGSLPEPFIVNQIIRPIAKLLAELEASGINHGCLNLDTIYFDKEITVQDCCALPSGILQKDTYESPDRLMTMPASKGAGETSGDYYALGIIAIHLYLGYLPNEKLERRPLIEKILEQGAYNAFVPEVELSDAMQDFLRGTLNEDRSERWSSSQLQGWISGKRYSAVAPSEPKDSARPFEYNKRQFFTRRQIANYLFYEWKTAKGQLSGFRLLRWLESNIKKSDVCTQVERVIPIGDDETPVRTMKDEELSRLLTALDPQAPVRYRMVSLNVDALGCALAEAARNDNNAQIMQLLATVDNNILPYSDNMLENISNPVSSTVLWRLQSLRPIAKARTLGFGFERILYQLNPSLCCQQKLLLPHYCYTIKDVLVTLDHLAARHAKTTPLADRHIAAFITNRLESNREIRIVELGSFPDMVSDESLIMLKILTMAQQKVKGKPLPGLTQWAAEMVLPTLEKIHQTSKREKVKQKVLTLADKGQLERITFLIFNKEMFNFDRREHSRAEALFRFHREMLIFLKDKRKIQLKARVVGQQTAWFISVLILAAVVYISTKPYL